MKINSKVILAVIRIVCSFIALDNTDMVICQLLGLLLLAAGILSLFCEKTNRTDLEAFETLLSVAIGAVSLLCAVISVLYLGISGVAWGIAFAFIGIYPLLPVGKPKE